MVGEQGCSGDEVGKRIGGGGRRKGSGRERAVGERGVRPWVELRWF